VYQVLTMNPDANLKLRQGFSAFRLRLSHLKGEPGFGEPQVSEVEIHLRYFGAEASGFK
jgi:hypothetical protein